MNNQLEDYSQTETAKYFGWLINIIIKSINIIAHILSLQSILMQLTLPGLMEHVLFICNKHHLTTSTSALSKSFRSHFKSTQRYQHDMTSSNFIFCVSRALSFLACSVRCNSSKFSYYSAEFQKMHDYFEVLWNSKIFQMRKPPEGKSSVYRDARSKHTGNTSTLWGGGIPNDHKWVEAEWRHVFHI